MKVDSKIIFCGRFAQKSIATTYYMNIENPEISKNIFGLFRFFGHFRNYTHRILDSEKPRKHRNQRKLYYFVLFKSLDVYFDH